jgi:hypothetical protein
VFAVMRLDSIWIMTKLIEKLNQTFCDVFLLILMIKLNGRSSLVCKLPFFNMDFCFLRANLLTKCC